VNYENGFQICTVVGSFKCPKGKRDDEKVSVMRSTFQKVKLLWDFCSLHIAWEVSDFVWDYSLNTFDQVRNFSHNIHPTHSYLAIAELHN
jgi:hypothetical protein